MSFWKGKHIVITGATRGVGYESAKLFLDAGAEVFGTGKDLARLDKAATRHKVKWEWIRGHDGDLVQEAVDKAARRIAASGRVDEEILRAAIDRVGTTGALVAEKLEEV